ncbi:hypothetical protein AcV5_009030 [Taiwanofungus camphoratus]|nr:hypothetical protein AcV5_009030 [Antrodia cinnamomea]
MASRPCTDKSLGSHIPNGSPPTRKNIDGTRPMADPTRPPELSQELYDMIVDMVAEGRDTKADLQACMLTSRSWLHRSRTHLFRRIRLKPRSDIVHFLEIYTDDKLLPYVREVTICGCLTPFAYQGRDADSGLGVDGQPDHTWISGAMPLLERFNNIEVLVLLDLSWGDIASETRRFLLSHFRSATQLTISAVDFWNSNQMLRTLQAFPRLAGLSMERLSWHRANHTRRQLAGKEPLVLKYLHLGETEFARYGPFVQWLLGERDIVAVDDAVIVWEDTEVKSLVDLLRRIAPSLRELMYQQSMVLPGSDVVEARLAAHAAQAAHAAHAAPGTVHNGQIVADLNGVNAAPNHDVNNNIVNEPGGGIGQGMVIAHGEAQDDNMEEENDDDNVSDDDDDDDDDDEDMEAYRMPGPSIELDDDELEDQGQIETYVNENLTFLREDQGSAEGMALLDHAPIENSRVRVLRARIVWSPLGLFGVRLMCQMVSVDTRVFLLSLLFPSRQHWYSVSWAPIDSLLGELPPHNHRLRDTLFEVRVQGYFKVTVAEAASLRLLVEDGLQTVRAHNTCNITVGFAQIDKEDHAVSR